MLSQLRQRGDTLIEVLFSFTIFSMVVVGAISIMNQGTIAAQRALETTLVRSEIDAQATTLRFLHDAYVAKFQPGAIYDPNTPAGVWLTMTSAAMRASASSFGGVTTCPDAPTNSFILNTVKAQYVGTSSRLVKATSIATVSYDTANNLTDSEGIWIEAIRSATVLDANKKNAGYIDFHIMACWDSPGHGAPMTLGTIVRLYEPRS